MTKPGTFVSEIRRAGFFFLLHGVRYSLSLSEHDKKSPPSCLVAYGSHLNYIPFPFSPFPFLLLVYEFKYPSSFPTSLEQTKTIYIHAHFNWSNLIYSPSLSPKKAAALVGVLNVFPFFWPCRRAFLQHLPTAPNNFFFLFLSFLYISFK